MTFSAEIRYGQYAHKTPWTLPHICARNIDDARDKAAEWAQPKFGPVTGNWFEADVGWMALLQPADLNQPRHFYSLLVTVDNSS